MVNRIDSVYEEFEEDMYYYTRSENYEVKYAKVGPRLEDVITGKTYFELSSQEEYPLPIGEYMGVTIHRFHTNTRDFKIEKKKIGEGCEKCQEKKFYDKENETFYCPICDNRITRIRDCFNQKNLCRIYDKIYNLLH